MKKLFITQALALSLLVPTSASAQITYDAFMQRAKAYKAGEEKQLIEDYYNSRKKWAAGQKERAKAAFKKLEQNKDFNTALLAYFGKIYPNLLKEAGELAQEITVLKNKLSAGGTAIQADLDAANTKITQLTANIQQLQADKTAAEQTRTQSAADKAVLEQQLAQAQTDIAQLKKELLKAEFSTKKDTIIAKAKTKRNKIATDLQEQLDKFDIADENTLKDKARYLALKAEINNAIDTLITEDAIDAANDTTIVNLEAALDAAQAKLNNDFADAKINELKELKDLTAINNAKAKLQTLKDAINTKLALFNLDDSAKNNLDNKAAYEAANSKLITAKINLSKVAIADDINETDLTAALQKITDILAIYDSIDFAAVSKKKAAKGGKFDYKKDDAIAQINSSANKTATATTIYSELPSAADDSLLSDVDAEKLKNTLNAIKDHLGAIEKSAAEARISAL